MVEQVETTFFWKIYIYWVGKGWLWTFLLVAGVFYSLISMVTPNLLDIGHFSLVGRKGYHAPPGNQLLIGVSRLEKMRRKRCAMLQSCPDVPRIIFIQISAAITEKCMFKYISANIADNWTNKVSRPMFWGSTNIIKLFLTWSDMSMAW
jgi:hypothetical protein